jgi:hypothetical protein
LKNRFLTRPFWPLPKQPHYLAPKLSFWSSVGEGLPPNSAKMLIINTQKLYLLRPVFSHYYAFWKIEISFRITLLVSTLASHTDSLKNAHSATKRR